MPQLLIKHSSRPADKFDLVRIRTTLGRSALPVSGGAICRDLQSLRKACGFDVRGILGMGLLSKLIIKIDCDAGRHS